jgi:hypothetical protein
MHDLACFRRPAYIWQQVGGDCDFTFWELAVLEEKDMTTSTEGEVEVHLHVQEDAWRYLRQWERWRRRTRILKYGDNKTGATKCLGQTQVLVWTNGSLFQVNFSPHQQE